MQEEIKLLPCPFCGSPAQYSNDLKERAGCSFKACHMYNLYFKPLNWKTRSTPMKKELDEYELKAFLGDRFAQCIREHSGQGRSGDDSFQWAIPYVNDCMPYLKSTFSKPTIDVASLPKRLDNPHFCEYESGANNMHDRFMKALNLEERND